MQAIKITAVVLAASSVALAQASDPTTTSKPTRDASSPQPVHAAPPASQPSAPTGQPVVAKPAAFEQMVIRGADGKVVRFPGFKDILALRLAPSIDDATWAKISPIIDEWMYDMDRSVIDNLDFVEQLDTGVLDNLNLMDPASNRRMMEMVMQFVAIGPLAAYLERQEGLTRAQGQEVTNISNEYYQQIMNEVVEAAKKESAGLSEDDQQKKVVHAQSRFIFQLMARDAMASYERQLDALAPRFEGLAMGVKPDATAQAGIKAAAAAIKSAKTPEDTRAAVKKGLAALSFDQRRAVLDASYKQMPKLDPKTAYQDSVDSIRAAKAK
jgi:hypothetical protein